MFVWYNNLFGNKHHDVYKRKNYMNDNNKNLHISTFNKSIFVKKSLTFLALSFFILFSLLFSTASFAISLSELQAVINENNHKRIAQIYEFYGFAPLPTVQESEAFLKQENKLFGPDMFMRMVLRGGCGELDDQQNVKDLIMLSLKWEANFQKVKFTDFHGLPSLELANFLLDNGFDSSQFLDLVFGLSWYHWCNYSCDLEREKQRDKLVNLAIKRGAKPQEINQFNTLPSLELAKFLLTRGLDPSKLYSLVSRYGEYDYGKNIYELTKDTPKELIKLRNDLLGLAKNKGIVDQNVAKFSREAELAEFNPETTKFSKMETIKTWVASKYYQNVEMMEKLQHYVACLVPHNRQGVIKSRADGINMSVLQGGVEKRFGHTFATSAVIELPFLQKVHEISKKKEQIVTLEIGAAAGFVSWKVPFAFENTGTHYANDLSEDVIKENFKIMLPNIFQRLQKPGLWSSIEIIPGSCFSILDKHPELVGKVDVIYVQNVEHFFNPVQHQLFLAMIWKLLTPGGYAYLSANNPNQCDLDESGKFHAFLSNGESDVSNVYYGYVQYKRGNDLHNQSKIKEVKRPEKDDVALGFDNGPVTVRNLFTPEVYRRAISCYNKNNKGRVLKVIDTFFLDLMGQRVKVENENPGLYKTNSRHAAAIIHKPVKPS